MRTPDASPHGDTPLDRTFRLLVRATDSVEKPTDSLTIGDSRWYPGEYGRIPSVGVAPEYTCISYSWGTRRAESPFEAGRTVSARALPALEVAIRTLQPRAIWLDAACVPHEEPARTACLRSMGAIYASASRIVAVLDAQCGAALDQAQSSDLLDDTTLQLLENDEWVTRAWTYQEMVNSGDAWFVAEGGGAAIAAEHFLNVVGNTIAKYKQRRGLDSFEFRMSHPRLDALESLIADWRIAGYEERSAFQIMSAMDGRLSQEPDDHFYAMIGAISPTPPDSQEDPPLPAAEYFMRVCEAKGDFSFIYSAAPRSETPGMCWRPLAGPMPAVLRWDSYGDGQSGSLHATHLRLDGMYLVSAGPMNARAREFIDEWLGGEGPAGPDGTVAERTLARLRRAGFVGCGEHLELAGGLFFPNSAPDPVDPTVAYVATGVRWVQGAPGLLVRPDSSGVHHIRDVGVFVGAVAEAGEPLDVGLAADASTITTIASREPGTLSCAVPSQGSRRDVECRAV